jgi:hypothetical protein
MPLIVTLLGWWKYAGRRTLFRERRVILAYFSCTNLPVRIELEQL